MQEDNYRPIDMNSSKPESIRKKVIETLFTRNQLIARIIDLRHLSWSEAHNVLLDSRVQFAGMDDENISIYKIGNGFSWAG
jgi:hypothetical protein